jgi:hypothetical protein
MEISPSIKSTNMNALILVDIVQKIRLVDDKNSKKKRSKNLMEVKNTSAEMLDTNFILNEKMAKIKEAALINFDQMLRN